MIRRAAVIAAALCAGFALSAFGDPTPRCFGAAARDPRHPCHNHALRYAARPGALRALITPNEPCTVTGRYGRPARLRDGTMYICEFGYPAARATRTVALLGDSHAMSWRAAVAGALEALHWHGVALNRSHCAFSTAQRPYGPADAAGCHAFNRRVRRYLRRHEEITGVFVAHQNSGRPFIATGGRSSRETEVAGFAGAWRALPPSIRDVFVIRDNPFARGPMVVAACARRARRAGVPAATFCRRPRAEVLRPDAFLDALARLPGPRYGLIDLTRFMCDPAFCSEIVGGVMVTKDGDHLTRRFAQTLAPYLLRRVRALLRR